MSKERLRLLEQAKELGFVDSQTLESIKARIDIKQNAKEKSLNDEIADLLLERELLKSILHARGI